LLYKFYVEILLAQITQIPRPSDTPFIKGERLMLK